MEATNSVRRNYVSAATPPGVNDDVSGSYFVGSLGVVLSTGSVYVLVAETKGAAVWEKVAALNASGDFVMPSGGTIALDRAALAAAGSTSADAAVIATQVVIATGADNAKGVALPAAAATEGPILIVNDATSRLLVYPVNGGDDQINALAASAAFTMRGGSSAWFTPVSATQWYTPTAAAQLSPVPLTRSTITDAATISTAQVKGRVLFQDASAGSVTMTMPLGATLANNLPEMRTGDGVALFCASNHASNTSTLAGNTGVTLVGSGAVTQLGGSFLLIKTGSSTFDLVRVG